MKRLLVNGDPGLRKGAVIEVDGEEVVCYAVTRNGDYHGPPRVQLSCIVGTPEEAEAFGRQAFIPHFLETQSVEADAVTVVRRRGDIAT